MGLECYLGIQKGIVIYGQLIFTKAAKGIQWEKTSLFNK